MAYSRSGVIASNDLASRGFISRASGRSLPRSIPKLRASLKSTQNTPSTSIARPPTSPRTVATKASSCRKSWTTPLSKAFPTKSVKSSRPYGPAPSARPGASMASLPRRSLCWWRMSAAPKAVPPREPWRQYNNRTSGRLISPRTAPARWS